MSNRVLPSNYIKTALHNGVGRYVCQLQRMTFKFALRHGNSNGLREFIEKDLVDFVRNNPGVVVYIKPRKIGPASITLEYLNGHKDYECFSKKGYEEIVKRVEYFKNKSGFPITRFIQHHHTDNPSIQGVWTPFTNKPRWLNVATFPDEKRTEIKTFFPTATEQVLELAKQLDVEDDRNDEHLKEKELSASKS